MNTRRTETKEPRDSPQKSALERVIARYPIIQAPTTTFTFPRSECGVPSAERLALMPGAGHLGTWTSTCA